MSLLELTCYTLSAMGILYYIIPITSFIFNSITLNPGTGRVFSRTNPKTKKKGIFVDTDIGRIKLPHERLPSIDTDIYFFTEEDAVDKNKKMSSENFRKLYSDKKYVGLKKYGMGIITDIKRPEDFKGKNKISGFICSLLEDYIYLFNIDNEIINYKSLFNLYEKSLGDYEILDELD